MKQNQFEELIKNVSALQLQMESMQAELNSLRGISGDQGSNKGKVIE